MLSGRNTKKQSVSGDGHATCPDCFDNGPHQTQFVKKKDGILSVKKVWICGWCSCSLEANTLV